MSRSHHDVWAEADRTKDADTEKGIRSRSAYKWPLCGTPDDYLVSTAMQKTRSNELFYLEIE